MKRYCEKCGKRMLLKNKPAGFDMLSGAEVYSVWLECPDYRWYNEHTKRPERAKWTEQQLKRVLR
jgi:hypothetical protein